MCAEAHEDRAYHRQRAADVAAYIAKERAFKEERAQQVPPCPSPPPWPPVHHRFPVLYGAPGGGGGGRVSQFCLTTPAGVGGV